MRTQKKSKKQEDYKTLFIKQSKETARLRKCVYVRPEFHERMMKIVHIVGENELSLFSYIDNVLEHHFNSFQEDITQAYKEKLSNNIFYF